MQHIIRTSTDLLPILCPDLYETAISPSTVFDWEQEQLCEELPESINPYDIAIDLNKYLCRLVEYANEVIEAEVLPQLKAYGVVEIKAGAFNHPSYYQLGSGRADIIVEDEFFTKIAPELERMSKDAAAQRYCKNHWQDRPGFWEEKVSENLYFEDFISEEDCALIAANRAA